MVPNTAFWTKATALRNLNQVVRIQLGTKVEEAEARPSGDAAKPPRGEILSPYRVGQRRS